MLHHYITRYRDDDTGQDLVVAWLQLNIFGYCICFSKRYKEIKKR